MVVKSIVHLIDLFRTFLRVELTVYAQYRANLALWLISAVTEPVIYMVVWSNVVRAQGEAVAGYTESDFAAYYLVLMFLRQATSAPHSALMAQRIRYGEMNSLLLRPMPVVVADFASITSGRLSTVLPLIPIVLVVGWYFGAQIASPWWSVMAFIFATLMTGMMRFVFQYTISMLAFWTDNVAGIYSTYWTLQTFLGGMLAPLALLPLPLQVLAKALPFRWIFGFPADLMLGRLTMSETLIGFAAQVGWTMAGVVLMHLFWQRGIRRYGAFGG